MRKRYFLIFLLPLFLLPGCATNAQYERTERPQLYCKDIDVIVEDVDISRWYASTHHYVVRVTVRSDKYQLTYTDEFNGSGAFGCPKQGNYRKGDIVKAELYSWVMGSTGRLLNEKFTECIDRKKGPNKVFIKR